VGESVQYLAKDRSGRELAVMVFGAAAWKVAQRDRFIGWSVQQRAEHLGGIANQQRFLILPCVRVPHLASHLLVLAARRLASDWHNRYGHRVWLIETFVEQDHFAECLTGPPVGLGQTTGRTGRIGSAPSMARSKRSGSAASPRFPKHLSPHELIELFIEQTNRC
jgi:hypothetical protein